MSRLINSFRFGGGPKLDPTDVFSGGNWQWEDLKSTDWKTGAAQDYINVSGSDVLSVTDKSGNGKTMTAGTNKPQLSGREIVFVSANANNLRNDTGYMNSATEIFFGCVISMDITLSGHFFSHHNRNGNTPAISIGVSGTSPKVLYDGVSAIGTYDWTGDGGPHVVTGVITPSGTSYYYVDGALDATNTSSASSATSREDIGSRIRSSVSFNGSLHESMRALAPSMTTDKRQKIEGYLAWAHGIQSQLVSGHPYKNRYPNP